MRWVVVCLLGVVAHQPVRAATYAVIVGVDELPRYRVADGSMPRPLRGAEHDARSISAALEQIHGLTKSQIRLLLGRDATVAGFRDVLAQLAKEMQPGDTFLFHFSGHGTQRPDALPFDEADDLDEALCFHDAEADGAGLLLDDELGRLLEALPADDVIVVLDCCHAGTGIKDDEGIVARYLPSGIVRGSIIAKPEKPWREIRSTTKSLTRRTTAFFACRPEQQAYERRLPGTAARVGQFSHYFWTGLGDAAADADRNGSVSRREAIDYAARQLDETFNKGRPDLAARQTPIWEEEQGELPMFPGKPLEKR